MGQEVARWFANTEVKQHSNELARIERQEEKAAAEVGAITRTTERAMMAGLLITRTRNMAEQVAPDAAEKLAMFDIASTGALMSVISNVSKGR
ncbi:hypothetical protein [Kribbella sindirgiensis]|uniref:Uncharacterized protein n=1 Tax=Kribbella sindirgiensis TaxID=1124744 RepID=A0A4R0J5F0_9ACTN|nr:hypothetical protein [Kribbella sindirgiensis]TCC39378.1 hypothetical protein E0H50_05435 [Kribbella sindirgiensis]